METNRKQDESNILVTFPDHPQDEGGSAFHSDIFKRLWRINYLAFLFGFLLTNGFTFQKYLSVKKMQCSYKWSILSFPWTQINAFRKISQWPWQTFASKSIFYIKHVEKTISVSVRITNLIFAGFAPNIFWLKGSQKLVFYFFF